MMTAAKTELQPIQGGMLKDIKTNYSTGYICLYRSIREHWLWRDPQRFQWWIDILMECNHKAQKQLIAGQLVECDRGQSTNSLLTWSKRWRTNVSAVRRFLKLLQSDSMIVTENVSKTTRLTVCNYDSYQTVRIDENQEKQSTKNVAKNDTASVQKTTQITETISGDYNDTRNDDETQMKRRRNADETQTNTNNNGNNDKNIVSAIAPLPKSFKVWNDDDLKKELAPFLSIYGKDLLNAFFKYWSEKSATGKMRLSMEKTWETKKRLETWHRRQEEKK